MPITQCFLQRRAQSVLKIAVFVLLFCLVGCSLSSSSRIEENEPSTTVVGMAITQLPAQVVYDIRLSETFSTDGFVVCFVHSDGTTTVCTQYTLSLSDGSVLTSGTAFSESQLGSWTVSVTASYEGLSFATSFRITIMQSAADDPTPSDDNPSETGVEPIEQAASLVVTTLPEKTIYAANESLDLSGLSLSWVDENGTVSDFTGSYDVQLFTMDGTEVSAESLSGGRIVVSIVYNDGAETFTATFEICVVTDIATFAYSENNGAVAIQGFGSGKTANADTNAESSEDNDDEYEVVASTAEDFIYEFVDGSETEVIITQIKEDRLPVLTDVTVPATLDGYTVTAISWNAFFVTQGSYRMPNNGIKKLVIEEGVTKFTMDDALSRFSSDDIMFYALPELRDLEFPKGFSLDREGTDYNAGGIPYQYNLWCKTVVLPGDLVYINFKINGPKELVVPATVQKVTKPYALSGLTSITFLGTTDICAYSVFCVCHFDELTITGDVRASRIFDSTTVKNLTVQGVMAYSNAFAYADIEEVTVYGDAIPANCFGGCTSLQKLTIIPGDSTDCVIDEKAFKDCTALTEIAIPQETIVRAKTDAFAGVPADLSDFATIIFKNGTTYTLEDGDYAGIPTARVIFEEGCTVNCEYGNQSSYAAPFSPESTFTALDFSAGGCKVNLDFSGLTSLESVIVSDATCYGTFKGCTNLRTISVGENGTFAPDSLRGTAIEEVTIKGIYYSETGLLADCPNLTAVTFDNAYIPSYCFGENGSDKAIAVSFVGRPSLCDYAFYKTRLSETLEISALGFSDGNYAFFGCTGLKELTLDFSLGDVSAAYLFACCEDLETVNYNFEGYSFSGRELDETGENTVDTVNFSYNMVGTTGLFYGCTNLKEVNATVPIYAVSGSKNFYGCKNLSAIPISDDVGKLFINDFGNVVSFSIGGADNFSYCENLVSSFSEKGLFSIFPDLVIAFQHTLYTQDSYVLKTALESVSGLGVKNLTILRTYEDVYWGSAVVGYKRVNDSIPTGYAQGNTVLETVTVDGDIQSNAFKGCSSLTTVILGDTLVYTVSADSFADCPNLSEIQVPAEYYEQYCAAACWSSYKDLLRSK